MEKRVQITKDTLWIPVQTGGENKRLEIYVREDAAERKLYEFQIPTSLETAVDYYAPLPVSQWIGKELILRGDFPPYFFQAAEDVASLPCREREGEHRPRIHFTTGAGWINDPNGLVYQDGVYHLYFQYNPFDVRWENMSWGHAVSRDLLHWTQQATVLYPDEQGTMFSGSAIVNDRGMFDLPKQALLYFYTAAGDQSLWSQGKSFTQHVAYSLDGGQQLCKIEEGSIPTISRENRDPKVFWHEESQSYICVLWLEENDFAILRSQDLQQWQLSHRLTLEGAWECPDLVQVRGAMGEESAEESYFVFLTADGYYYWGSFDGYRFDTDGVRHSFYMNTVPYAAQTYSNTPDRTILVPWLRLPNRGTLYTGAMGLPRELVWCMRDGERKLALQPVREYVTARRELPVTGQSLEYVLEYVRPGAVVELEIDLETGAEAAGEPFELELNQTVIRIDPKQGCLQVGDEISKFPRDVSHFSFLMDDVILEVTADYGTIVGVYEMAASETQIRMKELSGKIRLYELG